MPKDRLCFKEWFITYLASDELDPVALSALYPKEVKKAIAGCNAADGTEMKTTILSPKIEEVIGEMVRRIVERFHPEKIILFGSHARGDATPDSDVDLLVVMPFEGSHREKQIDIRTELHDMPVAKDILVTRPEELARRRDAVGTMERPAAREGKILYERS